ncbi:MAG: hypothetical protein ABWK15_03265 [Dissulfuribacterales bacterium]
MAEIKSSLEIALEKAAKMGRATQEEMDMERWLAQGRKLGAKYMNAEITELAESLKGIAPQALPSVLAGISDIFLRNIHLPRDKSQHDNIKRACSGLLQIKGSVIQQYVTYIDQLITQYEQVKNQYLQQLKAQMEMKLGSMKQAMAQQYGMAAASSLNVEMLPEFQKEWSEISRELDSQFGGQLEALKAYLR